MTYFKDLIDLISGCIGLLSGSELAISIGVGALLAGVCWWVCTHYSRLWNLEYKITPTHHVLCAAAAVLTLGFTVVFVSLKNTRVVALRNVDQWSSKIKGDKPWDRMIFRKAYFAVKKLNIEAGFQQDPVKYGEPAPNKATAIPMSKPLSKDAIARVYADGAVQHFNTSHPYLSRVVSSDSEVTKQAALKEMRTAKVPTSGGVVGVVSTVMKTGLDKQAPRVVTVVRSLAIGLFLLAQMIPFLWIGLAAYADLKTRT